MIKKLVVVLPLLLLGCAPAKPPVSIQSCDAVYEHVLDMSAWDLLKSSPNYESYHVLTVLGFLDKSVIDNAHRNVMSQVDEIYQRRGTTKKFYSFCTQHMTEQQVSCDLNAKSIDEINVCQEKSGR